MYSLGNTIKKLRKEYNMTQTDLANKLNITKSNISKYENNIVDPSLEILKTMSDIFDVSVDYLLGKTNIRKDVNTFAAHTDDEDLSEEAKVELENFKDYLRNKYSK
ncbi:helix-turn-helix transcriptional regulator [Peptostreptococcus russellii]|uniref:helix-turn-helix domain-containing protein n=1 Tax=Peptostreptococcus russellii TaxID=215200 RepID=UPI0016271F21|nr:helix-turn-helix transcriptional regulator [Peptostreptococcus russellii]MBC2578380.1 helix-turn-helix transcriptional regulator [Peptostreptococcus russellii]